MRNKRVLIVGAGGLGIPAALALARAGGVEIALIDPDPIELSNLPRQILFCGADLHAPKADTAARRLRESFDAPPVEPGRFELDASNASKLVAAYNFVIDATDNPKAKFLINDACAETKRPFVYGGVLGLRGQAMTVLPGRTACLRCLFEEPPDEREIQSCREAGIFGPIAGAIGEVQAAEAIAWLRGRQPKLAGMMLTYDAGGLASTSRVIAVQARRGCNCGAWYKARPPRDSVGVAR